MNYQVLAVPPVLYLLLFSRDRNFLHFCSLAFGVAHCL